MSVEFIKREEFICKELDGTRQPHIVCRKKLLNKVSSATDFDNCTEDISILHWTTLGLIG